jgi:transcriptional regulator GlxA family with amidase domain
VRLAMQRLRGDFGTQLSIGGIAEGAGLTRQKLQLGFRVLYGDTVARVRDRLRMEHALHLVRETSTPMIEIALDAGYEHAASFTRAFKAAYGIAPIRMRRMALDACRIREIAMRRD